MRPGPNQVHLWRWPLDLAPHDLAAAWATLAPDERARADGFHFALDRTRFVAGRAGLRTRLGRVLDRPPETILFSYGPFGKPTLASLGEPDLGFNLSHSGEVAILAMATGFELGVDIERAREVDVARLAGHTFAPAETARIASLPPADRQASFFRCWTRKEAYVKALGRGFDLPLESFTVSLAPADAAALLHVDGEPDEPDHWRVAHLEPAPGYVGAVAARRTGWRLIQRD